jgi:hypothetical protein
MIIPLVFKQIYVVQIFTNRVITYGLENSKAGSLALISKSAFRIITAVIEKTLHQILLKELVWMRNDEREKCPVVFT